MLWGTKMSFQNAKIYLSKNLKNSTESDNQKKILLIEDNPIDTYIACSILINDKLFSVIHTETMQRSLECLENNKSELISLMC